VKRVCEITSLIGVMVVLYSTIIPFRIFDNELKDIIYFRGIILGGLLISLSLPKLIDDIIIKSMFNAIFGGFVSIFITSTTNYICECIPIDYYYSIAIKVSLVCLIIIIIYRKWIYPSLFQ